MMKSEYEIGIFTDRYDKKYQKKLTELLSKNNLIRNAESIKEGEMYFGKYKKRVSIKFCGLSGLSILGGTEFLNSKRTDAVTSFLNLVSNKEGIVTELNSMSICIDIKVLFAYPYSDFMYDLIQAENTFQDGFSSNCVFKGEKAEPDFRLGRKLSYEDLSRSLTYKNLCSSLEKLQEAVNKSKPLFNHIDSPNRAVVKLTPLNILLCLLKINHQVFVDPYIYAKDQKDSQALNLLAPISFMRIPRLPSNAERGVLNQKQKSLLEHYCSLISHFRYLWQHPITMYSTDATKYDKGRDHTLSNIKKPYEISYQSKAKRIAVVKRQNPAIVDLWKQNCRNELIRYCSKFEEYISDADGRPNIDRLEPIPIFIVGTWQRGRNDFSHPNKYVNELQSLIKFYFSQSNEKGLWLTPKIVDVEDGIVIQDSVFEALNAAQLGILVFTADIAKNGGNANVFFERGYLTGRLTKRKSKATNKNKDLVFLFMEKKARKDDGTDTHNIAYTDFTDLDDFKLQFFRFVKWLWDVTELNSKYATDVIEDYITKIQEKVQQTPGDLLYERLLAKATEFINEINNWESEYDSRMIRLNH